MPLSDLQIRALQPRAKRYRVSDGQGLWLEVSPSGGRLWRLRYRDADGKEQMVGLGAYPSVGLKDARAAAEATRVGLRKGVDPAAEKRAKRAARKAPVPETVTFADTAKAWLDANREHWAPSNLVKIEANMANDILPRIGSVPIGEVTWRDHIKPVIVAIEERGAIDTARRALQRIGAVFKFAMADDIVDSNPATGRTSTLTKRKRGEMRAITDPARLGEALRLLTTHRGTYTVRAALGVVFHLPVRPGELRQMKWAEIDFEAAVWDIPAERMKKRQPFAVPLSRQVLAMLEALKAYTGDSPFVFPKRGLGVGPMSENTVLKALQALGLHDEMVGHGVRSTFSTLAHAEGWLSDAIERQLSHAEADAVKGAYDRGSHWETRVRLMQWWSDRLDALKAADNVVRLPARGAA